LLRALDLASLLNNIKPKNCLAWPQSGGFWDLQGIEALSSRLLALLGAQVKVSILVESYGNAI